MDKFLWVVFSLICLSLSHKDKSNKIEYHLRSIYLDSTNHVTLFQVQFVILNKSSKTIKTYSPLFTTHVNHSKKGTFLFNYSKEDKNSNLISFYILDSFGNKYFLFPAIVDCSRDFLHYPVDFYIIPKRDSVKVNLSIDFKYDSSLIRQSSHNCLIDGAFVTKPRVSTNPNVKYYKFKLDSNIRIYSEYRVNGHFGVDTIGVPFS